MPTFSTSSCRSPTQPIPPGIKEDIQKYYSNLDLPITTKKDPERWKQVLADLNTLAAMPTSTAPEPFPTYGDDQGATSKPHLRLTDNSRTLSDVSASNF